MNKVLYLGGPTWTFLTPEQMYDEEGKLRTAHYNYNNADIYFITKMRKVRFDTSKSQITPDGKLNLTVTLGDPNGKHKVINFTFPYVFVLYEMKHIKPKFESLEQFYRFALVNHFFPKSSISRLLYKAAKYLALGNFQPDLGWKLMKWAYSKEVKVHHNSPYEVSIVDPLVEDITNPEKVEQYKVTKPMQYERDQQLLNSELNVEKLKNVDFNKLPGAEDGLHVSRLTIDQVINLHQVDVGGQEVLYIGKTNREPFKRLLPHEKVQELESKFLRNDGEALVVHLLGFQKIGLVNRVQAKTKLKKEIETTACEAELINYFKPVMNSDYVKDKGRPKWEHILEIKSAGYKQIAVELDIDKQYTKFTTAKLDTPHKNRHSFIFDLEEFKRELGF
jgi:hypothetical protein